MENTLESIDSVLKNNNFHKVFFTGDINCDFNRNSVHVNFVREFLEENSFTKSWERFQVDFTHTHEANGITSVSKLDHFFWSQNLDDDILDAGVIHHVDNKSDHEPVYCVVKIKDDIEVNDDAVGSVSSKPRPCWKSATPEQREYFKESLKVQLEDLQVPRCLSSCSNCKCKDEVHIKETDKFAMETLETLGKAADCCANDANIPKGRKKSCMPGWSAQVKPFRDNAGFWFSVWKSAGRSLNTELHRIMKRTRNLYHYHVKKCRKSEDLIKRNNFLNSCLNGSADIFTEIKKLRKSDKVVANSIDGRVENIEEHFAGVYKNLYNSVDDRAAVDDI